MFHPLQVVRCATEARGGKGMAEEEEEAPEVRARAQEARLWHELVEGAALLREGYLCQDTEKEATEGKEDADAAVEESVCGLYETAPARTSSRPSSENSESTGGAARIGADGLGQTGLIMPLQEDAGGVEGTEEEEVRRQTRSVLQVSDG